MDIKTRVQGINPNAEARDISAIIAKSGNIYESIAIVATRAKQLKSDLREELGRKLKEFEETADTIEEIQENKEQIEISKFYERMPNPALIALDELLGDQLSYKHTLENEDNL